MKSIEIFTDGSSLGNPGFGGWAAVLKYNNCEKKISGAMAKVTNNQMELKAVIEALKLVKEPCLIDLFSDSQYITRGINEWLANWIKKDFKNIKNPQLWQTYVKLAKIHKIKAIWVKGHNQHKYNEICDTLARQAAQSMS